MPEQKMSYQERLECEKEEVINSNEFHTLEQTAERNVKAQAEAIREFYKSLGGLAAMLPYWDEKFLLEHGYIKPKTEDDGK